MKTGRETYDKHAFQNKELKTFLGYAVTDILDLPVCPVCECVGLRTHGYRVSRTMECLKCGYHGPTNKNYGDFISELLYE